MHPLLYIKIRKFCQVGHVLLSSELDKKQQEKGVACVNMNLCVQPKWQYTV